MSRPPFDVTKQMIRPDMVRVIEPTVVIDEPTTRWELLPKSIGAPDMSTLAAAAVEPWGYYPESIPRTPQFSRDIAVIIMDGVMHRTPRIFKQLFNPRFNPIRIAIDPSSSQGDIDQAASYGRTGEFHVGMKPSFDNNGTMENPNAMIGANFMRAILDGNRSQNWGIKGPVIGTAIITALTQAPALFFAMEGSQNEMVAATSLAGAGIAAYMVHELLLETPAIAASDSLLPIGEMLVRRAARIGSMAMLPPCLEISRDNLR